MMKRLLLTLCLSVGLLAGCNGGPEPQPESAWKQYVYEVADFAAYFGEDAEFWYTSGTVSETGECILDDRPETWQSMTLSTSTTGQWERVDSAAELVGEHFFADPTQGVWVSSGFSGQTCYVAWEEAQ